MKTLKRMLLAVCLILSLVCLSQAEDFGGSGNSMKSNAVSINQSSTKKDFPNIFRPIGNFFKRLFGKKRRVIIERPTSIKEVNLSQTEVFEECNLPIFNQPCLKKQSVNVFTEVEYLEPEMLIYNYQVSAGKIVGKGANVVWDLSGVKPGTYTITVKIDDGCGDCSQPKTREIKVVKCPDCIDPFARCPRNPTVTASAKSVRQGELITFTANADNLSEIKAVYNWSTNGEIVSGQNTQKFIVRAISGTGENSITATVDIVDDECYDRTAHATVEIIKD